MTATTATATITTLSQQSTGFLNSVLADLTREAANARTLDGYAATKIEIDRVRAALAARGAL